MTHPYADLPPQAFWRSAVAETDPAALQGIYTPKFTLERRAAIATAGSCFAQHVGRALHEAGLSVLDGEPVPPGCPPATARAYGYGVYSARYGNIYTTRQLVQLIAEALSGVVDDGADTVWEREGRFYDPLRPTIEPDGLISAAEVRALRAVHLAALRGLLAQTTHFIFTLGLTETWQNLQSGKVFPTCPGVVAGQFDPARHGFLNLRYPQIIDDLSRIRALLHQCNPTMRMILTVSPVPLTATASGAHVLAASTRSKAVLRAAAGDFAQDHDDVDYFPAYEIITNPAARGAFFRPNLREVTPAGVSTVMAQFLSAHGLATQPKAARVPPVASDGGDVICEEILLDAFRK